MNVCKQNPNSRAETRIFYQLPILIFVSFIMLETCFRGFSATYAGWPLVLSLVFVGMPHGAVDFVVNSRLRSAVATKDRIRTFMRYCVILSLSLGAFIFVPKLSLGVFVAVSLVHFGLADARALENRSGSRTTRLSVLVAGLVRGTLILASPFAMSPSASWSVFADILAIAGQTVTLEPPLLLQRTALVACGLAVMVQLGISFFRVRLGTGRTAVTEAVEVATIAAAFFVLDPLFAMGLYVIAWHSWRHMQPLSQIFASQRRPYGYAEIARSIVRLHGYSLPLLLPTVLVFLIVGWWRLDAWTSEAMAALTVAIFVVVTLPHHLLVEEMIQHLETPGVGKKASRNRRPHRHRVVSIPKFRNERSVKHA